MTKPLILFFPQYQAGVMPSIIPNGAKALRALWKNAPDFVEVPVEDSDASDKQTVRGVNYRKILIRQLNAAIDIMNREDPDFVLTTGGDCGASFAPIAYINRKYSGKIGVLWIDAHADIHVPSTSPSGNYHGMIVRHLMGHAEFDIKPPLPLKPHQIGYLGLRDAEAEEHAVIADLNIPHFSSEEVMKSDAPLDAVIAHFKKSGITHLYLHVDCDVMDSKAFPHVDVPEPNGLTLERLLEILQNLRGRMPVAGCCLTEYAPHEPGAGMDIMRRIYTEGLGVALPKA